MQKIHKSKIFKKKFPCFASQEAQLDVKLENYIFKCFVNYIIFSYIFKCILKCVVPHNVCLSKGPQGTAMALVLRKMHFKTIFYEIAEIYFTKLQKFNLSEDEICKFDRSYSCPHNSATLTEVFVKR